MGIGEKLARQRRVQGLSVEHIAASTGMSVRQVVAIESNAEHFAAPAEMGRMLRLYARKMGMSVESDMAAASPAFPQAPVVGTPSPIPHFLLKQPLTRAD